MSQYYNPKRSRNLFDPDSTEPFKLSRSKIDLFLECPRCFYIDRRLGVGRPPGFPFTLNSAVDTLLKKEFDAHRAKNEAHPLMKVYKIDAIPFEHRDIEKWRDTFKGVSYLHTESNFFVFGAIDDVWVTPKEELHIVDYKATSKNDEITLDAKWQDGYKRQMEIYQWLFRQNDFKVSSTGYFVYANALRDREAFDGKLEFDVTVIPYTGKDDWVSDTLVKARNCLMGDEVPKASPDCDFCSYRNAAVEIIQRAAKFNKQLPSSKTKKKDTLF
ncbi:MAG: PD-(D/E)XK nuclease family protein [Parcubacteria group bacterium]|nr:PD-(D/E)XK nuclease family protein [Parcubacteria group bacterium]